MLDNDTMPGETVYLTDSGIRPVVYLGSYNAGTLGWFAVVNDNGVNRSVRAERLTNPHNMPRLTDEMLNRAALINVGPGMDAD